MKNGVARLSYPSGNVAPPEIAQLTEHLSPATAFHAPPPPAGAEVPPQPDVLALARASLDDMKAEEIVEIDLVGRTSIADAMIIASGRSQRHVGSIADRLVQSLKDNGHGRVRVEGLPACDWVLIDAGHVIVHVFRPEVRSFYNLEKMWGADRPLDGVAV
ncbi:MAG: iojap-like protein [Enterovirga sp.]|nr:iojap-like protein [Enterovirga sp.]